MHCWRRPRPTGTAATPQTPEGSALSSQALGLAIFQVISDGINLLLFLFQGFLLQDFSGNFLESRLKYSRWNKAFAVVLFLLLRSVSWIWRPENPTVRAMVYLIWLFVITAVLVLGFYRASYGIASFLIVTFVAVSECSVMFAYTLLHVLLKLSGLWLWFFEHGYFLFKEFLVALELTGTVVIALYSAIIVVLIYIFFEKDYTNFSRKGSKAPPNGAIVPPHSGNNRAANLSAPANYYFHGGKLRAGIIL